MSRLNLTNEDYFNLLIIYGECDKVVSRTVRIFHERYPDRPRPSKDTLLRTIKNLKNHGSFRMSKVPHVKPVTGNEDNIVNIIGYFTAYPTSSLKEAIRDIGVSRSSILRVLHEFKFHPYSYIRVQQLKEEDYRKREQFCESILVKTQEENNFLEKIIWSDEAKITKNGIFNRRNCHYWCDSNPNASRERNFQESWSFNVYCAIRDDRVVAVHIYNENLTGNDSFNLFFLDNKNNSQILGERYIDILRNTVIPILEPGSWY